MPWWLQWLLILAVLIAAWFLVRAWLRRRPVAVDDKKFSNVRASAAARSRRRADGDRALHDWPQ